MLLYRYKACILLVIVCYSLLFVHKTAYADIRHTVQKGDTLYKISKEYEVPLQDIIDNNTISDITAIQVGTVIFIPQKNDSTASVRYTQDNKQEPYYTYIVIKGDTLFKISKRFNVKISTLKNANNLRSEVLHIDQKIKIPTQSLDDDLIDRLERNDRTIVSNDDIDFDNEASDPYTSFIPQKEDSPNVIELLAMVADTNENSSRVVSKDWPVSGRLYETKGSLPGVVIEGSENTSVRALKSGKVMYAALHSSFNNVVVIRGNDGVIYLYGGQKQLYVKQGDTVAEGQEIGNLGVMPTLKKAILYFSVWQNNRYIDPSSIIG